MVVNRNSVSRSPLLQARPGPEQCVQALSLHLTSLLSKSQRDDNSCSGPTIDHVDDFEKLWFLSYIATACLPASKGDYTTIQLYNSMCSRGALHPWVGILDS